MSFNPGDKVHVVTAVSSAIVLEQAGDLVYVELPNGVEMEYDASAIIYESDYEEQESETKETLLSVNWSGVDSADVWDAVDKQLQALTKLYHQKLTTVLNTIGPNAPDPKTVKTWDQVPCHKRLNILAVLTAIPVDIWRDAYENNKMSRLTLMAYAGLVKDYKENSYGV